MYEYNWKALISSHCEGTPSRRVFDPSNGAQILFIINCFYDSVGLTSIGVGKRLEGLICSQLPPEMTKLQVKNPFSTPLIYKAKIFLFKQKMWVDTDVYPVQAGLSAFETWPDIITSISLGEWTFKTN